MQHETTLANILRRDRLVVAVGLAAVVVLSWAYVVRLALSMGAAMVGPMGMPVESPWMPVDFALNFSMWSIMMVAMMVPSAAPMILMFAGVNRKRREQDGPYVPTSVFVAGYVLVWTGFAAVATMAQWGLHEATLLSSTLATTNAAIGGGLLVAAGVFQFTPLKRMCLTQCRSPLGFITTNWREGISGTLAMGVRHGVYCLGCCWAAMSLLFVLGVMNLLWVAALGALVLLEKLTPVGQQVGKVAGVVFIAWGAWLIITAVV